MENEIKINEACVDSYMELLLKTLADVVDNGYTTSKGLILRFYIDSILKRADKISQNKLEEVNKTAIKVKNILQGLQN